jgi:PTS system beta-glucosides-specific IIC component
MADNKKIAQDVLAAVGGKANITNVTHCMTRLRLNLKDESIPKDDEIKKIRGVIGVTRSGGQYQVIIGQNVPKVYAEVCAMGGFAAQAAVNETLDKPKEKLTLKTVGNGILNYLAGSMTPLIPVILCAGLFKTMLAVFGPDLLGLFTAESDTYILLNALYEAGFYFIPILLGFNAAKKLDINPILGAYMGCILITPSLLELVGTVDSFSVFGIPCTLHDYSQSVLPIVLSVWIMSYVNKFFAKHIPDSLTTIFTPFLTMLIMTPVSLCLLAPVGSVLGNYIGAALIAFGDVGGFLAVAVVAALWEFLVMTGMHIVLVVMIINTLLTTGTMTGICTSGTFATFAAYGVALGAFLRLKNKDEKSNSFGFFVSGFLGGVTEPTLYGLCIRYKRTLLTLMIGGFVGGAYAGITNVTAYMMASSSVLGVLGYVAGGTANTINGCIACALSMGVAAVTTYLFGFSKDELAA